MISGYQCNMSIVLVRLGQNCHDFHRSRIFLILGLLNTVCIPLRSLPRGIYPSAFV